MTTPKDWSLRNFYSKAWDITLKHKKLWILGLIVASTAGGSYNSSNFSPPSSDDSSKYEQEIAPTPSPNTDSQLINSSPLSELTQTEEVLNPELFEDEIDSAPDSRFESFTNDLTTKLKTLPLSTYIILGIEFVALIIAIIIFGLSLSTWAEASLIFAVNHTLEKDKVDLHQAASFGLTKIKSLIWLTIVPGVMFFFSMIIAFIVAAIIVGLTHKTVPVWSLVIAGIVASILFIYFAIRFTLTMVWAPRYAVIEDLKAKEALVLGWKTVKGNIRKMGSLGIVNSIVSGFLTMLVLVPFGGFGIAAIVSYTQNQQFNPALIGTTVALLIISIPVLILKNAIFTVFKYITWNLGFNVVKITSKTE